MKKLILAFAAIAMVAMASAQTQKGGWVVGTEIPLSTPGVSLLMTDGATSIGIRANAGYFIADNMSVNAAVGYGFTKYESISSHSFNLAVGARYYIASKFPVGVNYLVEKTGSLDASGALRFSAGYAAFLSENVAIEPALFYQLPFSAKNKSAYGLQVGFGYYF